MVFLMLATFSHVIIGMERKWTVEDIRRATENNDADSVSDAIDSGRVEVDFQLDRMEGGRCESSSDFDRHTKVTWFEYVVRCYPDSLAVAKTLIEKTELGYFGLSQYHHAATKFIDMSSPSSVELVNMIEMKKDLSKFTTL